MILPQRPQIRGNLAHSCWRILVIVFCVCFSYLEQEPGSNRNICYMKIQVPLRLRFRKYFFISVSYRFRFFSVNFGSIGCLGSSPTFFTCRIIEKSLKNTLKNRKLVDSNVQVSDVLRRERFSAIKNAICCTSEVRTNNY